MVMRGWRVSTPARVTIIKRTWLHNAERLRRLSADVARPISEWMHPVSAGSIVLCIRHFSQDYRLDSRSSLPHNLPDGSLSDLAEAGVRSPILSAVITKFLGGILRTWEERWFDGFLLLVVVANAIFGHHTNIYDKITTIVWLIFVIAGFHIVRVTIHVWRDRRNTFQSSHAIILSCHREVLQQSEPPYLGIKLTLISVFALILLLIPSYFVKYKAMEEDVLQG